MKTKINDCRIHPSYRILMQYYLESELKVLSEFSGSIMKDSLAIWKKCNEWLMHYEQKDTSTFIPIMDENCMIQNYLELEDEED